MPESIKPRPKNQREILDEAIGTNTYDPESNGRSPLTQFNRALDESTKGDRVKDVSIGIVDIDTAIIKYIENKIKPSTIQDGNRIQVPVMYGYPERWQTIQEKGALREYNGRFLAPVIVLKRDSLEANRTLGTKVDANKPQNLHVFETGYTKKNQYDNFTVLNNRIPIKEFRLIATPEYVTLTYSAVIFTNHLEQNNKIIEALKYAENTYWGEEGRFQFRSRIDSFTTSHEYSEGDDRTTRTNFTIILNGYIIPDTINRDISHPKKFSSKSQIIFNLETDVSDVFTVSGKGKSKSKSKGVVFPTSPQSVITPVDPLILNYLNANKTKIANIVTAPNLATFTGASFLQPPAGSGLPPTDKNSFSFFINGQYIPPTAVISFDGSNLNLNTIVLQYVLETDDEVSAIGKFQ
jgi:hypothetical protein